MRLGVKRRMYGSRPFSGEGASLYLASGVTDPGPGAIVYRNHRIDTPRWLGTLRTDKTNRVASVAEPTDEITYDASALASKVLRVQVRPYLDDVELETISGTKVITLDGSGDDATGVAGEMLLLATELRDGGGVIIRTRYTPSLSGVQPTSFAAVRTAGPTSPTSVTATYGEGFVFYDFEFTALSSASAYTFKITGTNGVTTTDLITGISVTVDTDGPPAPTGSITAA